MLGVIPSIYQREPRDAVSSPSERERARPYVAILLVPLLAGLALALFAWPASRLAPRDLPVGVAGPAQATRTIEHELAGHKDEFDVHRYADATAARQAIKDRQVYGAVVVTRSAPELLVATGASVTVAQTLEKVIGDQATGRAAPDVQDVVPAASKDFRGTGLWPYRGRRGCGSSRTTRRSG